MTRGWPATFFVAFVALASAGSVASVAQPATPSGPLLASHAHAVHILNRLAFGPRPGDVDRVLAMGADRWIEEQLRFQPDPVIDSTARLALKGCESWTDPLPAVIARLSGAGTYQMAMTPSSGTTGIRMVSLIVRGAMVDLVTRDSAIKAGGFGAAHLDAGQMLACRLTRVETSDQQLLEVLTDFWENHFSVYGPKVPSKAALIDWDRGVIRRNALGRFRDLLGAVAHSPAMLEYLDNAANSASAPNENYARELLELHTLGVNGGYTQADVIDVARAFTGWTHNRPTTARPFPANATPVLFIFDSTRHDDGSKVILGRKLPSGRGIADGEEVLDLLARHPSTARFIARKLVVRFVSDVPPDALVERAAKTFQRTDGDIRAVVRTIVTSPEFRSELALGAKVKTPQELVLSMRRVLAAPVDTAAEMIDLLIALDQPPFSRFAPDGWPETATPWMTVGTMLARFELAERIAQGRVPSIPVERWPGWSVLVHQPFDTQVEGVIRLLLGGHASPETRAALGLNRPREESDRRPEERERALRELIALALSSPEFQRR